MPSQPDLLVRDTLRGLRHAVRRTTHFIADEENRLLPRPISDITSPVLRRIDGISQQIEDISSSIIGGPLQKARVPAASFFGPNGYDPYASDSSPEEAGSALYFGLSRAARALGSDRLLISETICLDCINQLKKNAEPRSSAAMADELASAVLDREVFRLFEIKRLPAADPLLRIVIGSAYACALWFSVPRGIGGTDEEELIEICCAIIDDHLEDVFKLRDDGGSAEEFFEKLIAIV